MNGTLTDNPERFWKNVAIGDGCWEWRGHKDRYGYGVFRALGSYQRVMGTAHRVALQLWNQYSILKQFDVMHKCDNPACCRPDHLSIATAKENMADAKSKGRLKLYSRRKISDIQAEEIRQRRRNGELCRLIALDYGVSDTTISAICTRLVTY